MAAPYRLRAEDLSARGDAVALASRGAAVTYAELAARAAAVGAALAGAGVCPDDRVALLSSGRAHDEPVALVGVLTAGAVAVPLDATAPPARLGRIARGRGCRALVLDAAARGLADGIDAALGGGLARVELDAEGRVLRGAAPARAGGDDGVSREDGAGGAGGEGAAEAQDLACILHTSGSTGEPKPVPITWAGLDAFTAFCIDLIGLAPADRVLRVAELVFDLAWFDHLATFRAGATLATMARRDLASGRALRDAVAALAPTVIYGVPSMFMKLVAALPTAGPGAPAGALSPPVRAILFAGEVFPPRELAALAARAPGAALYNLYGPTETNVCTFHRVDRAALDGVSEVPIGVACPYAACALLALDADGEGGRAIEGPGTGELVVSGPTTVGGGPYRTRDRVERKADGLFYFRGRIDRMVKIRGYRVEPGEVEAALAAHPAVRQAAVIAVEDARLGKTLRGFVGLAGEADDRALRMHLAERLPPYMVPETIVTLDELPRTPTGKIDYRALPG
ncbi:MULTISPECIES: AMP-binding protein [Sorangium]|uniref:AMP-dependent ligase n=1 Tax=Sorangium cellulosum TaxID=56 RepID=A0A4P2QGJ2_SORCE|nr:MULTISPECIES: AMP-binding protein [Sorangium]AUX28628.1 AMP-dependent ligase [Sorangium cellulosum]WCQ88023.1 Linear gramicidin synthase subunit D [Sorangium sp. Soce836]